MKIAVLGTGSVGDTVGSKLVALGHEVKMGSRSATNEKAQAWAKKAGGTASHGTFEEAAAFGEVIFNCTSGAASIEALTAAKAANLKDKVLVDVANPLDFSKGQPPSLFIGNTDSLGELIQRTFPSARVVKALNTMWCGLMVNPRLLNEDTVTYVAGNDPTARDTVKGLLKSFGWKDTEILDLGDLSAARATEAVLPIWLRVYGAQKSGSFNFRIVAAKT